MNVATLRRISFVMVNIMSPVNVCCDCPILFYSIHSILRDLSYLTTEGCHSQPLQYQKRRHDMRHGPLIAACSRHETVSSCHTLHSSMSVRDWYICTSTVQCRVLVLLSTLYRTEPCTYPAGLQHVGICTPLQYSRQQQSHRP